MSNEKGGSKLSNKLKTAEYELLRNAVRLCAPLIDDHCGNCEDTPCDDMKPSYVCPEHKWLKRTRKFLKEHNDGK